MIANVYILKSGGVDWELFTSYTKEDFNIVEEGIEGFVERDLDFNIYSSWQKIDKYQCFGIIGEDVDMFRLSLEGEG